MEPMTLGSPVGSPVQIPGSPGNTSAYLPSFLLGDTNTPNKIGLMSPSDNLQRLNTSNYNPASSFAHYSTPEYRVNRQKVVFGNVNASDTSQINSESHSGGPPTRGLFDNLETSPSTTPNVSITKRSMTNAYTNQNRLLASSANGSFLLDSPLNLNSIECQGLLQWVTVFGFPPSAMNIVLSHISSRVRIIDKHPAPQTHSNWIHLKCASEQEVQRALACNGNIVSGSIMIGVIPCTDEAVVLEPDKENHARLNGSIKPVSLFGKVQDQTLDQTTSPRTLNRKQHVRPLAVGYNQHLSPQSVKTSENVPQKSTSLVSKAMEYVFGW